MLKPAYKIKSEKDVLAVVDYARTKHEDINSKIVNNQIIIQVGSMIIYTYFLGNGRWIKNTRLEGKNLIADVTGSTLAGMKSCLLSDIAILKSVSQVKPKAKENAVKEAVIKVLNIAFNK